MTSRAVPGLRLAALLCATLGALAAGTQALRAQALVADLSHHLIAITTGFTGTEVVLFGAVDGPGDVAVVVQGPPDDTVVRRKERVAGIWLNTRRLGFTQVPSFYRVATTRPLGMLVEDSVLQRHEIGLGYLNLVPGEPAPPETVREFREALIRKKQEDGLYSTEHAQVAFLGERLFRTTIYFPANVPTGAYIVSVYLIRDGDVVSAQTTPLAVSKIGFSADVYDFATRQSLLYATVAIVFAMAAGWLAGAVFRRV
ncbi:TIGR02186 family protein [Arenibaculum sp.]|jgi:uncharacterized protein (TIGR02186 family)|uniref:TIGR02186 family protein n=1 Tax=Arenibaculum sp. TaxID=2865862 RepID=UPI002E109836|nr:TIGR02186 family protein [Arenibaculum sp.]